MGQVPDLPRRNFLGRFGLRETIVRRMLDPDHATKPEKIQTALEALGKRFLVAVEDAA